jgi:SAM-dependent methyltransferase
MGLTGSGCGPRHRVVDPVTLANRTAWETASVKYLREFADLLAQADSGSSLLDVERELLSDVLRRSPDVVHLQSGHGLDDVALVRAGAKSVVGVDYSSVAAGAAQRRADELGVPCRYVVAALPGAPLASASADLVYTGKGALIWMPDLTAWARDAVRLLRPSGQLFVYEGHPAVPLWTRTPSPCSPAAPPSQPVADPERTPSLVMTDGAPDYAGGVGQISSAS